MGVMAPINREQNKHEYAKPTDLRKILWSPEPYRRKTNRSYESSHELEPYHRKNAVRQNDVRDGVGFFKVKMIDMKNCQV